MTLALEQLPLPAITVDADRVVLEVNDLTVALLHRAPAELLGRSLTSLIVATAEGVPLPAWADRWHPSAALRSVVRIPEHEVAVRSGDGGVIRCQVAGRYRRGRQGDLRGAVLVLRAMAPRRGPDLSTVEVVSAVSHELRSPLTSVRGYTSLLLDRWERVPDDQKRAMLGQVRHDADRVTRLVTELLDIARLETGELHLRRQLVDLAAVAHRVVDEVRREHEDLGCTIDFPDDFPRVYADPDKVAGVLANLVENAAKYASPSGLAISGSVGEDVVAVAVRDRGEGIPSSELPRVFTRFFRRELARPTGTGLGLWMSRGLVEAHGGRLTVESTPGEGSTFRFTLPTDAFDKLLEHHDP